MPGSQKFSQNYFLWKILSNFLMVFDISLEMQKNSKKYNYVSVQDDEITELVHTIKSVYLILENLLLHRQLVTLSELLQISFFWT